jgi:hypothetical protein
MVAGEHDRERRGTGQQRGDSDEPHARGGHGAILSVAAPALEE